MKANSNTKLEQFKADDRGLMFNMLINAALAIVIIFALMNIGTYINGQIADSLIGSYPTGTARSNLQNMTVSSLQNITADYDDVLDIETVTVIIMVIMLPLAAIISIKKLL